MLTPQHGRYKWMHPWRAWACWGVLLCPLTWAVAQPDSSTQPTSAPMHRKPAPTLGFESIAASLAELNSSGLPDELRAELTGLYAQALDQLNVAADWAQRAAEYRQGQDDAPAQLAAAQQRLAQTSTRPASSAPSDFPPDAPLDELLQRLNSAGAQVEVRRAALSQVEDEFKARASRRAALPTLLAGANKRLEDLAATLDRPPAPDTGAQVSAAQRILLGAQRRAVTQEVQAYEEELRYYTAQSAVLTVRREEAARTLVEAQRYLEAVEAAVRARRQAEAEQQRQRVAAEFARAPQSVRDLAEGNATLAQERTHLAAMMQANATCLEDTRRESLRLRKELEGLRRALQEARDSQVLGARILRLYADPAQTGRYRHAQRASEQEAARAEVRRAEIAESQAEGRDPERRIQAALAEVVPGAERSLSELEPRVRELFETRDRLLADLDQDYENYANDLVQLQLETARLRDHASELSEFAREHGLWVPSAVPLTALHWPQLSAQMVAPAHELGRLLAADLRASAGLYGAAGLLLLALLALRPHAVRALAAGAARVGNPATDSFELTLAALVRSVQLTLPGPALLWLAEWRVLAAAAGGNATTYALAQACGAGLGSAALLWFAQGLLWQVCRPGGMAAVHFGWNPAGLALIRRHAVWVMAITVPTAFVAVSSARYLGIWYDSLGRLAFMLGELTLTAFLARIFYPQGGVLAGWLRARRGPWSVRLWKLTLGLAVAAPLALAALSAWGYHSAALVLGQRLTVRTGWLILGVLLGHALLVRWLVVARHRLAAPCVPVPAGSPAPDAGASPERLSAQTVRLLRSLVIFVLVVGLWLIWADLAPAVRFLGDLALWSYAADGGGGTLAARVRYVTLANLAVAMLIVVATVALTKDIPALLEMALLRRLPLDTGGRFAVTTVARYVIVVAGIVGACGALSIGWSRVQWLAAAVTVGLGFGLQEIFANFAAGLVLLFERPIRIGDVVTVGDISGTVTRIEIRATTITNWDCKELIIPNKQFITGQIINWTLSSAMLRIVVPVSVARGSDPDQVQQILLRVTRDTPHILTEPPPSAVFARLGEGVLEFELRLYIADVNCAQDVQHHLNRAIHRAFREAGIELACPQRDVRIQALGPVARTPGAGGGASPGAHS